MKELFDSQNLSPIELAKRLRVLKSMAGGKSDFDKIRAYIVPEDRVDRVAQILDGLEQEDEFAVLCRLMGTCESISEIGQSPIVDSEEIAPDYIASFAPDCTVTGRSRDEIGVRYQCFVEVKSSKKATFKISANDLRKRRKYAQRFGLPLVFAVRFMEFERHAFWVIMGAEKLEKNGRKIEASDFIGNLNAVLFDDLGLMTHPHLHVAHYYDAATKEVGIRHTKFGTLVRTVMLLPDKEPIVVEDRLHALVNAFLDVYDFEEVQTEAAGDITCVVSHIGMQTRFLSDILFRINRLAIDEHGDTVFDAGRAIAKMDSESGRITLLTREMVVHVVALLNSRSEMVFTMGIGKPDEQEKALLHLAKTG